MPCTLDICATEKITNPTADEIEQAVLSLNTDNSDAYVILDREDGTFMQATGDPRCGFSLEHQEGNVADHFQASRSVTADELVKALTLYSTGSEEWRKLVEWEPMQV